MNVAFKCEKMTSNVSHRLKLSTMDNREENKNFLIEDKIRSEAPFELVDIQAELIISPDAKGGFGLT
jgi:hypothetical protein